jgi:hypothetical protein
METFISDIDILSNIKKYRNLLSYDEMFDVEMETKIMKLSDKGKARFNNNLRAHERRSLRNKTSKNK